MVNSNTLLYYVVFKKNQVSRKNCGCIGAFTMLHLIRLESIECSRDVEILNKITNLYKYTLSLAQNLVIVIFICNSCLSTERVNRKRSSLFSHPK